MRDTKNMKINESVSSTKKQDPVKIYIDEYSPTKIVSKLSKLDKYFKCTNHYIKLLSNNGIFKIENNKIHKLKPNDKPIVTRNNYYDGAHLVMDQSIYDVETIYSQIPYHHTYSNIISFEYCQTKDKKRDAKLTLIVEGVHGDTMIHTKSNSTDLNNKYYNFVPTDFYFLATEEIDNYLIKQELNEFLSMLI